MRRIWIPGEGCTIERGGRKEKKRVTNSKVDSHGLVQRWKILLCGCWIKKQNKTRLDGTSWILNRPMLENQGTCKRDHTGFHLLRSLCIAAPHPKEGCSRPEATLPISAGRKKQEPPGATEWPTQPPNTTPRKGAFPESIALRLARGSKPTSPLPVRPLGRAARANGGGPEVQRPLSHANQVASRVRRS